MPCDCYDCKPRNRAAFRWVAGGLLMLGLILWNALT